MWTQMAWPHVSSHPVTGNTLTQIIVWLLQDVVSLKGYVNHCLHPFGLITVLSVLHHQYALLRACKPYTPNIQNNQ